MEAQTRAEEEEKRKAEETEKKAQEEEKRAAEEAQAAQEKEKQELLQQTEEPQPTKERSAESEQLTRQTQQQQTQDAHASVQSEQLAQPEHEQSNQNEAPPQQEQSVQQEKSTEQDESHLKDQPIREEQHIQQEYQVQQDQNPLQEKPFVREPSLQAEQHLPPQSDQPKVQSGEISPKQIQTVEQVQSSHESQSEQQLEQPIKQEAQYPVQSESVTENGLAPVSASAPTAPQEIQHASMDIDRSDPVEPVQEETKTFSVEEASAQQEQPQTFTINQGPVYEPVEPVALSEQSAAQPESGVSEIKFVNHDTVETPKQEVTASQAAPQEDALTMQIVQAKEALEADENHASSTVNTLNPERREANFESSNQQPVTNEQNYFNVAPSQVPQSSDSQSQVPLNEGK